MSQPLEVAAPIVAAGLAYWSEWVEQFNRTPTPLFIRKHDLILHAVKLGFGMEKTRPTAAELALATFPLIENSGYWPAWLPLFEAFPNHFDDIDPRIQAYLLNRLGQLYRLDARLEQAAALHQKALDLASQLPHDSLLLAAIRYQLGEDYLRLRRLDKAKEHALLARQLAEQIDPNTLLHDISLASIANVLGLITQADGNLDEAADWFTDAIRLYRRTNHLVEVGRMLNNFALLLQEQGKFDEALLVHQQSLAQLETVSSQIDVINAMYNIGVLHMAKEEYEEAEAVFRAASPTFERRLGPSMPLAAFIPHNLGYVIVKQGRFSEAEPFLRQAVEIWTRAGNELGLANCLDTLAEALCGQGELAEGCRLYRQALALLAKHSDDPRAEEMRREFSQAYALRCKEEMVE